MENFVEKAYAVGGAWGIATLMLCYAVVYLYRAREREHKSRLKEARENSKLMAKLLATATKRSVPPRPLPPPQLPMEEDWEEESTLVANIRSQQVREMVIQYIEEE